MIKLSFSPISIAKPSSRRLLYDFKPSFLAPAFINKEPIASLVPEVGGGTIIDIGWLGKPTFGLPVIEETKASTSFQDCNIFVFNSSVSLFIPPPGSSLTKAA